MGAGDGAPHAGAIATGAQVMQAKTAIILPPAHHPRAEAYHLSLEKAPAFAASIHPMSKDADKTTDIKQDPGKLHDAGKQARLAEALRANLRKRKEQMRDRKSDPSRGK
ncbi:hypothetical protein [Kordiimonas sp.]|uniref:hypothetical protein n=1 Tax=Kordiimonas sp. TaxID=1970157 RepID=UPI003A90432C